VKDRTIPATEFKVHCLPSPIGARISYEAEALPWGERHCGINSVYRGFRP